MTGVWSWEKNEHIKCQQEACSSCQGICWVKRALSLFRRVMLLTGQLQGSTRRCLLSSCPKFSKPQGQTLKIPHTVRAMARAGDNINPTAFISRGNVNCYLFITECKLYWSRPSAWFSLVKRHCQISASAADDGSWEEC